MNVVWKQAIYQFGDYVYPNYGDDLEAVFNSPVGNNFSVKVIYYLDYLYLRKK